MAPKRKKVVLSITQKLEIISKLEKDANAKQLAAEYDVGKSTIYDIKKQKEELIRYQEEMGAVNTKQRKTMKTAANTELDEALYLWFTQRRSQGQPVTGPLLIAKAKMLNDKLGATSSFNGSVGWLNNFKARHGIRQLKLQGEILSADEPAAEEFKKTFLSMIQGGGVTKDRIYNADETGLNWKALPDKTLASSQFSSAPGHKVSKERITVLVAANASGSHALPLFVIGKSQKPRSFANMFNLPVVYRGQKNAWMDSSLFNKWYIEDFIPNVLAHQRRTQTLGKTILLLDNAPCHPSIDSMNNLAQMAGYTDFEVMYLPPNVTSLIQPMDQGVIEKLKRLYRKEMLKRLLLADESEESVKEFLKKISIKDCCFMLADCWKEVTSLNLSRAWHKICMTEEEEGTNDSPTDDTEEQNVSIITSMVQDIPGCSEVGPSEVEGWLAMDATDVGYQVSLHIAVYICYAFMEA